MKTKLLMQSLSPFALLILIRNLSFRFVDANGQYLNMKGFVTENLILLIVLLICAVWLVASFVFYIQFKAFKWADKKRGYQVNNVDEHEEASLNFYITIIIPLLMDDVNTLPGAISLALIVLMLCVLLCKTKLFYANPVLSFLGYRFYEFSFLECKQYQEKYVGISQGLITNKMSVEYKVIAEGVFYLRGMDS